MNTWRIETTESRPSMNTIKHVFAGVYQDAKQRAIELHIRFRRPVALFSGNDTCCWFQIDSLGNEIDTNCAYPGTPCASY